MRIAVVGAGPAGLTAAYRLVAAGHEAVVFEAGPVVGGRTHTEHLAPGHWTDDGAGWLASFYPSTLALLAEVGLRGTLRELSLRGGGDLLLDGSVHANPNSLGRILRTDLLSAGEKVRFLAWMAQLMVTQAGGLRIDDRQDPVPARSALAGAGAAAADRVVRPSFEGPFFSRLEELSGALVRSWLRDLSVGTFFQVDGGMDSPWRHLADRLDVRLGAAVERVTPSDGGVEIVVDSEPERFDGAVVAVPAPLAARIVADAVLPPFAHDIVYASHVRVYAARPGGSLARSGTHALPNDIVATVELGSGRAGSWGRVPDDWDWALVCAPAASSGHLIDLADADLVARMWQAGTAIEPRLFPLESAEITHVVRWRHAVPKVGPGYFAPIRAFRQRPPVVFAGDWLVQPCVEGAVRSGDAAAAVFGSASG